MFAVLLVIVALSTNKTQGDSTPSLSIGPPPMINDEIHPSCWNFTYGNWRIQEFYSPNFPGEYATDVDCVQYLQAPPSFKIQLHFDSIFAVEKSHECQFDYLEIRDGPFAYSPLIGRYCSLEFPPLVTSTGRYLWLRFKSDDVLQYTGFKAVYSYHKDNTQNDAAVVNKVESYPACYFHLRLGLDKSFDYFTTADLSGEEELELPKGSPVDCTWEIFTERGYSIYLNGQDIRLNHTKGCHRNNITVFDRTTLDKDIKVNVCKDNVDKFEYSSDSNRIFVRVYTESIKHKPSFRIKYLLTRKGQCNRESERKCDNHCVPLKHVCKVAELCKDVTEMERCAVKTSYPDGPRKNINGVNTEKKREEKLEETKEGMGLSQLYVIILGALGGFILTCVVVGLCIMCHLRKRGRGKRQDSNATAAAAAASHKSPQRNALEIAVCNSSNTSMSLSRQNEISGNRQGGLDRQHYVAFGRMNSPAPNNAMMDNSHRYSITDHHLQGPEGERIPDVMTESGNYKRFLTMEMTPDDIMIEQGVYPGTPTGVMGVTSLDHRMPDIYGNYHGNMWHPKDDNVYPYGSASLTRPTPFLGMSKTFSYTQPESKYEIKYLKTMKPVDNDALKEHQAA